jgi:hypothetical protein
MSDALAFAKARIDLIERLAETFGNKKINLRRTGTTEREGIWCVPLTEDDRHKMDDDSCSGAKVRVYLTNMPLPWGSRTWGAEVIATTRGRHRPEALPKDQAPLDAEVKLLWEGLTQIDAEATRNQEASDLLTC